MSLLRFLFTQFFLIFMVAISGGYKTPDVSSSDWRTVLFLTPVGIIYNYLDENPVMRSFYLEPAPDSNNLSNIQVILLGLIIILLITNSFWFIYNQRINKS